jgi:hypothetical protein
MHVPTAADLVSAWEHGLGEHPIQRALTLLSLAYPTETRAALASLSVGERDRRLLALHGTLFGPTLNSCAECPRCGAELEFRLDAGDLLAAEEPRDGNGLELTTDDLVVRFRLPTSEDLEAISDAAGVIDARRRLAERCIVEAMPREGHVSPPTLADTTVERIAAAMTVADVHADAVVHVHCEDCHHAWALVVDIGAFLWAEVNALSKGLLRQVHALAWAYGWREADVLGMTSARRALYLQMVTE